jgi:hypothetical protein
MTFARNTIFPNKIFPCHDTTYTRLEARYVCMTKILVTEIALMWCSRFAFLDHPSLSPKISW